jgi:hypothetical protein
MIKTKVLQGTLNSKEYSYNIEEQVNRFLSENLIDRQHLIKIDFRLLPGPTEAINLGRGVVLVTYEDSEDDEY